MANKDLTTTEQKKQQVKELYLKGVYEPKDIAKKVGISYQTALSYINFWKAYYSKLAINNPHIAQLQYQKVKKLEDEIDVVKQEYWNIYEEIKNSKEPRFQARINQLNRAKSYIAHGEMAKALEAIDNCIAALEKEFRPKFKLRLETLKNIVDRVEKENKLNMLFNPEQLIAQNFVSIKEVTKLFVAIKDVIQTFIPMDKQKDATARLKQVEIKPMDKDSIIDAEYKEE